MGAAYEHVAALDGAFHMGTYSRKPVLFVRGEGMRLYDDDGREYLDFMSGIGAVNLGHAHPAVAAAVCEQSRRLVHVSNLYHVEHRAELAEELVALMGGHRKVFFCNSGAEANEGAIKLARRWGRLNKGPECIRIVTAERGFHGRTMGALSATGQSLKQEAFAPLTPGFSHVPLNDLAALESALTAETCAVLLEPVQGEAGVYPCDPAYLKSVAALCEERAVLLVLDEVQTGFFRTGPAFAYQGYGVDPDIVCLAKSIANGLPAGAFVAKEEVADAFSLGDHGSTFAGGPVVCAAARATIASLVAEDLGTNALAVGAHLHRGLSGLAERTGAVEEVRSRGLMVAMQLREPVAPGLGAALLERGLVVNTIGERVVRLLPPLVCTNTESDILFEALSDLLPFTEE